MKTLYFLILLGGTCLAQTTQRVSVGAVQAVDYCSVNSISADGRYVAFVTEAANLVSGDTNAAYDVFLRDRQNGTTELVSVNSSGVQGNGSSGYINGGGFFDFFGLSISADARYVAFVSNASNLAAGVGGNLWGIFVRDRQSGTTELVSADSSGMSANYSSVRCSISADGRYVAFETPASNLVLGGANGYDQIVVHDRQTGTNQVVSVDSAGVLGTDHSYYPALSADGRYVAFLSSASNLVPGDTNGTYDVFVHDRITGVTERMSVDSSGVGANGGSGYLSISGDGRYVAFESSASNLVPLDTNGADDIFLRDRQSGTTELVSVNSSGVHANNGAGSPSISADGRYVAFESSASNLVSVDTNGKNDVFVRDRLTGMTERVSVDSSGAQGNADSGYLDLYYSQQNDLSSLSISADGRVVAFESSASNFAPSDFNLQADVFAHDRQTGTTQLLSLGIGDCNSVSDQPCLSADGRYVAFHSSATNVIFGDTNGVDDVFAYNRATASMELVSVSTSGVQGDGPSYFPALSSDGRFVAFESMATNLVAGDANGSRDIFVRDRQLGSTERVSLAFNGAEGNSVSQQASVSADGRYVAFASVASNLVASDTNGASDIFVRDRLNSATERVSVATGGAQADSICVAPAISADGRYVAFMSFATNLVAGDTNNQADIFVHDRQTGTTERVNLAFNGAQANFYSYGRPSISSDGRFVAFDSAATNLVAASDTNAGRDVFVRDRVNGTTERMSVSTSGVQGNDESWAASISGDGRFVSFQSAATNLVAGDTNSGWDIFVHDRLTGSTERVSVAGNGAQANSIYGSEEAAISSDGRLVVFASLATNLVAYDTNGSEDVFVRDRGPTSVFSSFCFGDGSGGGCPCGNNGNAGHGCQNSASTGGAVLTAVGGASLSLDTVTLTSSSELPTATSTVLQGISAVSPVIFGDGLRCAGGTLKRLYTKHAVGGVMTAPQAGDPTISARSSALGDTIPLGSTRIYQAYYRDANLGFCPGGFNVTNAVAIAWGA